MSSQKLLAYKAIIEHASLLAEIIKNPEAIRVAAKEYAAGYDLGESKKAEVEKSLQTIEEARIQRNILNKEKIDFADEVKKTNEKLIQRKNELDYLKSQCDDQRAAAEKVSDDAKKIKIAADDLAQQTNNRLFEIDSREKSHQKSLDDFALEKEKLTQEKITIEKRMSDLGERESAIAEFSGKLKR